MCTLDKLAKKLYKAKKDEKAAKAKREQIEADIVELVGAREEGAKTHEAGDYKVTVTGKLTRTLDADAWRDIESHIPEAMRPVNYKPTLDVKGVKYLQDNEPDVFAQVAKAITTKPAKTSVTVKEA